MDVISLIAQWFDWDLKGITENKISSHHLPNMIGCFESIWETFLMDRVYKAKGKKRKL